MVSMSCTMQVWLFSMAQCVLSVSVIGVSVRLCMGSAGTDTGGCGRSASGCLKLCLAWVGAVGGAVGVPVNMLLNLRSPQCMYTCITLVCCPLLIRQFTIWLLLLLIFNAHLQCRLGPRYSSLVTRQRMLYLVLLSWVCSVFTAFAQFMVRNSLDTWREGATELGWGNQLLPNFTSTKPPPKVPHPYDRSVIGKHLPYGGFLSKFLVEDLHNFTYEEIHSSHWGICAPDTVLSPNFLVYIYAIAVFVIPVFVLLAIYLDLMCLMPKQTGSSEVHKRSSRHSRCLALSLSLLVLLCLPLHVIHALRLFSPSGQSPIWVTFIASILFQAYSLVPPLLFSRSPDKLGSVGSSLDVTSVTAITVKPLSLSLVRASPGGTRKGAAPPGV
ncbi:adenosine receptor A1-like [Hoplias malabaricus]|uniref:adenosine receptor A1-like n=1 Tax=Hoplias malabaricus TaxID=27720 RepID=UPI0034630B28